jgi:2-polyprenyl-3-methyl-5-hydroxy-6-metoxy-1,4-benzoquinol methylase
LIVESRRCAFCRGNLSGVWLGSSFCRCVGCGLIARTHLPSDAELYELYAEAWDEPSEHAAETGSMDDHLARQYVLGLLSTHGRTDLRGLRLLDFGAGTGALAAALEHAGADVYAVEPYGHRGLVDAGHNAFASLEDVPESVSFDGVITMDVAEHLPRPWEDFARLYGRIRPGGWICVSTPNPSGLSARVSRAKWREAGKTSHLVFLSETTLARMLRSTGFASISPARWHVRYGRGLQHELAQRLLNLTGLQGASRLIAYKPIAS